MQGLDPTSGRTADQARALKIKSRCAIMFSEPAEYHTYGCSNLSEALRLPCAEVEKEIKRVAFCSKKFRGHRHGDRWGPGSCNSDQIATQCCRIRGRV